MYEMFNLANDVSGRVGRQFPRDFIEIRDLLQILVFDRQGHDLQNLEVIVSNE